MLALIEQLWPEDEIWRQYCQDLNQATALVSIVWVAWRMGLWIARALVEDHLNVRAQVPSPWSACRHCGRQLHSKGFEHRQMLTLVGWVKWRRRVGCCPNGCQGSRTIPFDQVLEIGAYQQTSDEVRRFGCLLCVFLPFELSSWLLRQFTGLQFESDTLWSWVQTYGQQAMTDLSQQLARLSAGEAPEAETLEAKIAQMTLAIGVDGVKVPLRPHPKTPQGKTCWREVKIAVLARLGQTLTRTGKTVTRLYQRRLVAVLGDLKALAPRLQLEAMRQGLEQAPQVVWLSDGAPGFWKLYQRYFAAVAIGVLDFYHAAGHLWRAAAAYLDGRTQEARWWFELLRHQLRHGHWSQVLRELIWALHRPGLSPASRQTLQQVAFYLQDHIDHIDYRKFEQMSLPLGSGLVESACKWLIQQRFKGVGMRWSEAGFNHLLHLRLAWVNDRFDILFGNTSWTVVSAPSLNR
jgi:hypothetical protein